MGVLVRRCHMSELALGFSHVGRVRAAEKGPCRIDAAPIACPLAGHRKGEACCPLSGASLEPPAGVGPPEICSLRPVVVTCTIVPNCWSSGSAVCFLSLMNFAHGGVSAVGEVCGDELFRAQ